MYASRPGDFAWTLEPDNDRISCGDVTVTPTHRCHVMRSLREVIAAERNRAVHAHLAADRAISQFMRTGAFTHFADCRFVHRARPNLLPLNYAAMWRPPEHDQRCATCRYQGETLPHVLCHCMARSAMYTAQHNAVVARRRLSSFFVAFENRPDGTTGLRSDLVLYTYSPILSPLHIGVVESWVREVKRRPLLTRPASVACGASLVPTPVRLM